MQLNMVSIHSVYVYFPFFLSSWEHENRVVLSILRPWLRATPKTPPSVLVTAAPFRTAAGLDEWSVCLGFPVSRTFFFLLVINNSANDNILPLNSEWWVYQEGPCGVGEGGWGDYVSQSQDWPPIVIISSQGESWKFSNIDSRIIPLCYTIFEVETASMKFIPQQTFLPPVPTEGLPLWP